MALATPLSSGIQVSLIEQNTDTLLSVKAHNADFVLGENTLKLWAHSPDGYYSITDYSIEGADSLIIPLSNIRFSDSSGEAAYLDLVVFSQTMGLVGSDNAIPSKGVQRVENLTSEDISSFSRGSEGFVFPNRRILDETIRNLMFHVTMWFGMVGLLLFGFIYAIKYILGNNLERDVWASLANAVGLGFGILGLLTGMVWAKYTWGAFWVNDAKLNGAGLGVLMYLAYFLLRNSIDNPRKRARISATYNVIAFVIYIMFIFVLPRLQGVDSLHPGQGGNPAFSSYDLDNALRIVFYPAVIGWTFIGFWIFDILRRMHALKNIN
ncbi:MAG: cytochrome C biogenesis protein [Saprospirales bacterium]|nr:cytochrome C biogenesis protein [Saprospirales bacterium]|tara:strand:+ start:7095 stop:8063 length:969 start_codon:yes stop_codon:yes gene_type:complete